MTTEMTLEYIKIGISSVTLISIWVALRGYALNRKKMQEDRIRDSDRELLSQAQKSLQWAYDTLTDNGASIPPKSDRLNWLTCARHLLRTQRLSQKIESDTYRIIFDEIEEFWRQKFYVALNDRCFSSLSYFTQDDDKLLDGSQLEPVSAAVVYRFTKWREDRPDPVDSISLDSLHPDEFRGYFGIGFRRYLEKIASRRKSQS